MHDPLADRLLPLARKYLWWMPPEVAVTMPDRVVALVMNLGDYDDVQFVTSLVGEAAHCRVLTHADIGQFSPKSWAYWHYRLGLDSPGHIPPRPTRTVA